MQLLMSDAELSSTPDEVTAPIVTPDEAPPADDTATTFVAKDADPVDAKQVEVLEVPAQPLPKSRRVRKLEILPPMPKLERIAKQRRHEKDVGSSEVQIGLLTDRILHLTAHLKVHPKDKHTNYGLRMLVSRRKRLLKYLEKTKPSTCTELKAALQLR